MSKPLFFRGKKSFLLNRQVKKIQLAIKSNKVLFVGMLIVVLGLSLRLWDTQPVFYAQASSKDNSAVKTIESPLFKQAAFFADKKSVDAALPKQTVFAQSKLAPSSGNEDLRKKLYEIVGDAPIREMVPFISERDEKVAAFLVGIAKKESSFGSASPSKNGQTCYNYWGYKGSGGRGTGMGYACFASAEEAIKVVGDRIEVLVAKDRNTPARMVNTWKCGTSCAGDPGAPSWISTVALYFDKIVG